MTCELQGRYAVIGLPIEHSLSPQIHRLFAKQCGIRLHYEKTQVHPKECHQWIKTFFAHQGSGLNITLPLKELVFEMADCVHPRAMSAKAANTLWHCQGKLHADNTDGIGFIRDIKRYIALKDKKVLILGAGGAARGILEPLLEEEPYSVTIYNRSLERAKAVQDDFPAIHLLAFERLAGDFEVIVNATPPTYLPLQKKHFSNLLYAYDLNYKQHQPTPFVEQCKRFGWHNSDGLGMLVEQAAASFFIWHGQRPCTQTVLEDLRRNGK